MHSCILSTLFLCYVIPLPPLLNFSSRRYLIYITLNVSTRHFNFQQFPQLHSQGDILDELMPHSQAPLFKPRILKSTAESKLRQLQNVYFPPRKKVAAMPTWTLAIEVSRYTIGIHTYIRPLFMDIIFFARG